MIKSKNTNSVIITKDELRELIFEVARMAKIYGLLGYSEDKEALYRLLKTFAARAVK